MLLLHSTTTSCALLTMLPSIMSICSAAAVNLVCGSTNRQRHAPKEHHRQEFVFPMPSVLVCRWNVSQAQPSCETSFEGHIDWVNDVLLFHDKLVTCSSDKTVKLWQAGEEGVQQQRQNTLSASEVLITGLESHSS